MTFEHRLRAWLCALLCLTGTPSAQAQEFPSRPLRIIVTSAAGSGIDTVARMVAQHLADAWRQPVIVDNRLGAAGQIGGEIVARAAPDGHTLLMASPVFLISASLYAKLPYDFARDFAAVARIGRTPYLMAVHPALNARTTSQFIALAKAQPGRINYGSNGTGTIMHLAGEMLKAAAGIDITHVPYKGSPQVVTDVISGQIDMMFNSVTLLAGHVQTGKLRGLGIASNRRSPLLPDLVTLDEAGLRGFEVHSWYGLVAPTGTPARTIAKLNREIDAAANGPAMAQRLAALGTDPIHETPDEFAAAIRKDIALYGRAIEAAGMKGRPGGQ